MTNPLRLAVVMTTFNRCATTLRCLDALHASAAQADVAMDVILVDDGSTDGTADQVRARWPATQVLHGHDMFWCRGMHRGLAHAMSQSCDGYLWLNDDTLLRPDALPRLLACERGLNADGEQPLIVVGSTVQDDGHLSYGGHRCRSALHPLKLQRVDPGTADGAPQPIDTMNGNVVWVNAAAARRVGNLDPAFAHAMGDIDYGLRAGRLGVGLWLAPGVHGVCRHNAVTGTHEDASLPLMRRFALLLGRKGLPWSSWLRLTRRHAGWVWPALFAWPYVRLLTTGLLLRPRRGEA